MFFLSEKQAHIIVLGIEIQDDREQKAWGLGQRVATLTRE